MLGVRCYRKAVQMKLEWTCWSRTNCDHSLQTRSHQRLPKARSSVFTTSHAHSHSDALSCLQLPWCFLGENKMSSTEGSTLPPAGTAVWPVSSFFPSQANILGLSPPSLTFTLQDPFVQSHCGRHVAVHHPAGPVSSWYPSSSTAVRWFVGVDWARGGC